VLLSASCQHQTFNCGKECPESELEVAAAGFVAAVAIQFDQFAGAFAGRAAVFAVRLRGARTGSILTFLLFFVSHGVPPKISMNSGGVA
jgi:hypothetical protein